MRSLMRTGPPVTNEIADASGKGIGDNSQCSGLDTLSEDYPDGLCLATALDEFAARAFIDHDVRDDYVARHGLSLGLPLIVTRIAWQSTGRWCFAGGDDGVLAAVLVVSEDVCGSVEAVDLLAWHLSDPSCFGLMFGACSGLNLHAVDHAGTYVWDTPLKVFKTPLAWAKSGGGGVVVFHDHDLVAVLCRAHGRIQAEDREHALHIARHACASPLLTADRIVFAGRAA